eukprot:jgi/Botrbrau1/11042/Bobra.92_2s0013.2
MAEKLLAKEQERATYVKGEWEVMDDGQPGKQRHDSPDMSPVRRGRHDVPDISPPRKRRHDSPDQSPPRQARRGAPDASPPRKARHASPDLSPPRRGRHDSPDISPPRKARNDSPGLSPPRRACHDSLNVSPSRTMRRVSPGVPSSQPTRQDSRDISPPRKPRRTHHDAAALGSVREHSSSEVAPPRRARHDSPDISPPRRRTRHDSPDMPSPLQAGTDAADESSRGRRNADGARRSRAVSSEAAPRDGRAARASEKGAREPGDHTGVAAPQDAKRAKFMSDGTIAGMVSGRAVVEEMERKRAAERERFEKLDASVSGKGAATVYRDRQGRIVDEAELKQQREAERKPKHEAPTWGAGLKQIRDAEERQREIEQEAARPFARSKDDKDLDALYRQQVRFGDPMAHLVRRKQAGEDVPPPEIPDHVRKQMKKRGFVIPQEIPPHSWLKRKVGPPINRYGIRPGRFWDGVDRSNGFENELFATRNARLAMERETQMWSQADM